MTNPKPAKGLDPDTLRWLARDAIEDAEHYERTVDSEDRTNWWGRMAQVRRLLARRLRNLATRAERAQEEAKALSFAQVGVTRAALLHNRKRARAAK